MSLHGERSPACARRGKRSPGFAANSAGNNGAVNVNLSKASALLAAVSLFALPTPTIAQTAMTGSQQSALLQSALARIDAETQMLATMRNHIPSREIVTVSVAGLQMNATQRRALGRAPGMRHAALVAALSKATVADVDRNNGQSPDQSSLAEYLQHLGIDPNNVVAVDVNTKVDPQNPRVTVFYRGRIGNTTQGG
jgi:sulfur carrier protein ThiS